ncbi:MULTISPECIES: hypothetical protein [Burkholderiales]|jgi:hypothetical protein|uniref:Uncharacterized protein n=1 Tax=Cupriavidus basilensis TaxID=68895 RepID=A0A643FN92_9BURK|nr:MULTISPECIES: hypothetical protein [Burkholderiales]QOT82311.1 hypothetical protein F7R26_040075 [Cupriavidus basilensis]
MKRVIPFALVLTCSVAIAGAPVTDLMADPLFMAKVASYHGMTPMRLANQSEDRVRQMVLDYLESQQAKPTKKAATHGGGAVMKANDEVRQ